MSRATAKKKREKSIEELTISWTSKDWLKFLGKLQPYAQRMVLAAMRQQEAANESDADIAIDSLRKTQQTTA